MQHENEKPDEQLKKGAMSGPICLKLNVMYRFSYNSGFHPSYLKDTSLSRSDLTAFIIRPRTHFFCTLGTYFSFDINAIALVSSNMF